MSDDPLDPRPADRLTRAARAAQALSETLWEALHEELIEPRSERVAELSGQLADISMAVASLARVDTRPPAPSPAPSAATATLGGASDRSVAPEPSTVPVQPDSVEPPRSAHVSYRDRAHSNEPAQPWEPSTEPDATRQPLSRGVLIDELAPAAPEPLGVQSTPQIEIRDVRGEEGPAAWIGSIGRRLERHEQDGSPFAVLLVELVDIERLHRVEPSGEVSRLTGHLEDALARELRPADSLTREGPGRYWLLAPQTDATGAQMLVERIARAVRFSTSHRGMPLEVAVGVAVCPDDGRRASELAAHADVGLYAARSAGRSSIR